jgi:hypothetical protein
LSPDGSWLGISNCCSDWAIDVVDLRDLAHGNANLRYRIIDEGHVDANRCPGKTFACVVMRMPDGSSAKGQWRPHDVHFSRDGKTSYVAAINSTWIVDVSKILDGAAKPIAYIPNLFHRGTVDDPHNISISHQANVSKDGKILVVSDERGGGLSETGCNTDKSGVIGGLHFFALGPVDGRPETQAASPASPVALGDYFIPNPLLAYDALQRRSTACRFRARSAHAPPTSSGSAATGASPPVRSSEATTGCHASASGRSRRRGTARACG